MPPHHRPRRARIDFSDSAGKEMENITFEAELHAHDRVLVVLSVDPDVDMSLPDTTIGPHLREYTDDVD